MNCKFCRSDEKKVVKSGKRFGLQRYLCKVCAHKFYDNQITQPRMRVNMHTIVTALDMFYGGLSMRKTAEMLDNIFGEKVSQSTIHFWVHRFAQLVSTELLPIIEETGNLQLSGKFHHDETELRIAGQTKSGMFWQTVDFDTRFIVASLLTESRTTEDAKKVFRMALEKQRPTVVFTDGSYSYDEAIKVFYSKYKVDKVEWIRRVGIRARETNNVVERLHSTLKDRTYPMRGLKTFKSTKSLLEGYVINYNYCRKHQTIKMTPAQAAGCEIKGWGALIAKATESRTRKEIQKKQIEVQVRT